MTDMRPVGEMSMDSLQELAEKCSERNAVVRACREEGEMTLDAFLSFQAEKVSRNQRIRPLCDPADFITVASHMAEKRIGSEAADEVRSALRLGVICTADHHGGIFCPQTFQGDLLYGFLLQKLGYTGRHIPIFGAAQVELSNATYARGICLSSDRDEKQLLPLFRRKYRNMMTFCVPPVSQEMIDEFRRDCLRRVADLRMKDALESILDTVYESDDVLSAGSFSAQTTRIGVHLSEHMFSGESTPAFTYLEAEEAVLPLFVKELRDGSSLLTQLLSQPAARKELCALHAADGVPLAGNLFGCADGKGRKVFLLLEEDGMLAGKTLDGEILRYPADPSTLADLLESRRLFPGLYALALLLAFERGITWMGGMFQSLYLPEWQRCTVRMLEALGFAAEADCIRPYDGSGYLCGPVFALFCGDGFAAPAGPAEIWMIHPELSGIRKKMAETCLWNAHVMGLSEMVPDLFSASERADGWYRSIAEGVYRAFPGNMLHGNDA